MSHDPPQSGECALPFSLFVIFPVFPSRTPFLRNKSRSLSEIRDIGRGQVWANLRSRSYLYETTVPPALHGTPQDRWRHQKITGGWGHRHESVGSTLPSPIPLDRTRRTQTSTTPPSLLPWRSSLTRLNVETTDVSKMNHCTDVGHRFEDCNILFSILDKV